MAMRLRGTPVPIPNTTVKPQTADGTALETVWESRWPPNLKKKRKPTRDESPKRVLGSDGWWTAKKRTLRTAYKRDIKTSEEKEEGRDTRSLKKTNRKKIDRKPRHITLYM